METSSVSNIKVILELRGKGKLKCELKRHLSPRTMGIISRSLPFEGNAHLLGKSIAYLETAIDSGIDRPRSEFKKGDIAFLPANGSICFIMENVVSPKKMTPLGKILTNLEILNKVESGDVFLFYLESG